MTADRIKEIQSKTAFPDSVSVCQALLQVWNECEQDYRNSWSKGCECKNSLGATWCCNSCGLPTNKDYLNSLNKQD